jgi:hypothetical protein
MVSAVLWALWVAVTTEALSEGFWISRKGIAAVWLFAAVVSWLAAIRAMKSQPALPGSEQPATGGVSGVEWSALAAIGAILSLTGIVAFAAAPNSWDAMQYSMPRVLMWLQNHSVRMYPTVDYQQLMMSPWADYAMAHMIALQGSDRFADFVAWFAFAGSIVGVSLIARELGGGRRAQALAALLCATIPSAILFASSSKPDETISFWIVACVYFLLRWRAGPRWGNALLAAAAAGLAIMTKGTAYVLLPAILAAIFWIWPGEIRKRFLPWIPVAAIVILMLNGPLYMRNIRLSGSPLGFASPDGEADTLGQRHFANAKFKPRDIAGNVLRNISLHFGSPSARIDALTEKIFRRLMRGMGVDPDDPKMIEGGNSGGTIPFGTTSLSLTETRAGNSLLLLLFVASVCLIPRLRSPLRRDAAIFAAGLTGAFILFCAGIRWQPWNARFHLPLFMLACAVAAIAFSECGTRWIVAGIAALAIVGAAPFIFLNSPRPLVQIKGAHRKAPVPSILGMSRDRIYFADQHLYLADSFLAAARFVEASGCRNVGLDASVLHYDYPMLVLLGAGLGGPTVRYVDVHNRSAAFSRGEADPCAVVCLGCSLIHQKWTQYGGESVRTASFDRVEVFLRSEQKVPAQVSSDFDKEAGLCGILSAGGLRQVIGEPTEEIPGANSCVYEGPNGRLLVSELPSGEDAGQFDDLESEGMGSLAAAGPGFSAVVVFDSGWPDKPLLMYLSEGGRLFGVNLDRPRNAVSAEDFLRVAGTLRAASSEQGNSSLN